jgi:hypothetical protein
MNNKLLQWIRANLLGIFGCMYLPKKDAKYNLVVCDISFLVIYTVVAITTVIFFTTIICHSNIPSLERCVKQKDSGGHSIDVQISA